MLALIQRVKQAKVCIDGVTVGAIGAGLLIFFCAEPGYACGKSKTAR